MTKEDVVPKWLGEVLHDAFPSPAGYDQALATTGKDGPITVNQRFRHKPRHELRVVCGSCNNGWMSRLEGEVRSALEPIVLGGTTRLSLADQVVVALWFAKVAVLLDADGPRVLTDADRASIRLSGHPPMGSHVRLAFWSAEIHGPFELWWSEHAASRQAEPTSHHPNSMSATARLGRGVLTFVGGPGIDLSAERWASGKAGLPLTLWPPTPQGIAWPPAHPRLRTRDELIDFHEGFWAGITNPEFPRPDARKLAEERVRAPRRPSGSDRS